MPSTGGGARVLEAFFASFSAFLISPQEMDNRPQGNPHFHSCAPVPCGQAGGGPAARRSPRSRRGGGPGPAWEQAGKGEGPLQV
jgi:hypothetical protein